MRQIPFDLEKAKAGAKIVARCGEQAVFVAHMPNDEEEYRVVVVFDGCDYMPYCEDGTRYIGDTDPYDLFLEVEE